MQKGGGKTRERKRVNGREKEKWREGVIVSIAKKMGVKKVEEHRGVTLMPTAYKEYAVMLAERLRGEIEEKGILSEGQTKFGKGREVIDNIYILNYVVERKIVRGNKIVATFVDLKEMFDSVNRGNIRKKFRGERG